LEATVSWELRLDHQRGGGGGIRSAEKQAQRMVNGGSKNLNLKKTGNKIICHEKTKEEKHEKEK